MKMGSIIGQKIDYKGVGALRGQWHIPSKHTTPGPKIQKLTMKCPNWVHCLRIWPKDANSQMTSICTLFVLCCQTYDIIFHCFKVVARTLNCISL